MWFDPTPMRTDEPTSTHSAVYNTSLMTSGQSMKVQFDKNSAIRGPGSPSRRVSMFSSSAKYNPHSQNNAENPAALSAQAPFGAEDSSSAKVKAQRGMSMKDHFDNVSSARTALQNLSTSDSHEALAKLQLQAQRPKRMKNSDMGNDILEGFILSSGLDQRVLLWNLQGKCVGEFGSYGWEIDSEATWYKGQNEKVKRSKHKTKKQPEEADLAAHYARETAARNITKETVNLVRSPSSILIQNIGKHRHHTSKELNDYVEALSRKIGNKPPVYLDEDAHFSSIMVRAQLSYSHRLQPLSSLHVFVTILVFFFSLYRRITLWRRLRARKGKNMCKCDTRVKINRFVLSFFRAAAKIAFWFFKNKTKQGVRLTKSFLLCAHNRLMCDNNV